MANYKIGGISDIKIGYVTGGSIVYEDVPLGNRATMNVTDQELTFEGDNTQEKMPLGNDLEGEISHDKLSDNLLARLFNKTAVTTGLPTGTAKRFYFGNDAETTMPFIELVITVIGEDDAGAQKYIRITVPKAKVKTPKVSDIGNRAKMTHTFGWTAQKTTTDINGGALPSVPADGAKWFMDILS